jgi:uncharacterized membrane protein
LPHFCHILGAGFKNRFALGIRAYFSSKLVVNGLAETVPCQEGLLDTVEATWNWWALAPLFLACASIAAPFLCSRGLLALGWALQRGFALVCHQQPERSFWIFSGRVAICARCLGIYLGTALGLRFSMSRIIALRLLIIAAAFNLLDAATEIAGLHGNWLQVRFGVGLLFGTAAGLVVRSAMANDSRSATQGENRYSA